MIIKKLKKTQTIRKVGKKNLKKKDLIEYLSIKSGLSKNFSKKLIEDLIDLIIINIQKRAY